MNNDNACLICFEEDVDTILACCHKKIHGSCVKQWWEMNNISLEDSICPHCRQSAKLEKINELSENNTFPVLNRPNFKYSPYPENVSVNIRSNQILPQTPRVIVPNINYNLTDEEIQLINSNSNNVIPDNMFSHEDNPDDISSKNSCLNLLFFLLICGLIIIIIILVTS